MAPSIFSVEELKQHDGSNPDKPLYICVKGIVFDVSESRQFYGPGVRFLRRPVQRSGWQLTVGRKLAPVTVPRARLPISMYTNPFTFE